MKFTKVFIFFFITGLLALTSCLSENDRIANDYSEWKILNDEYLKACETQMEDGSLYYDKIIPEWDKSVFVLVHWHNDRSQNVNLLKPLSNSTVTIKYTLTNIEGDTLDSSASLECQPNGLITGFWTALTNMNVKDTVTAVIPYSAAYGITGSGAILPFSTLTFGIRLDSINKLY